MYLRVSSIEKHTNYIIVNMANGDNSKKMDIAAIFIMAVESKAKQVRCNGESTLQAKALAYLAASLKQFEITLVVNSAYTPEQVQAKARQGKYIRTLLDTGCLRCG